METKCCSKCKKNKSLEEFYFRKDLQKERNECKKCMNEINSKREKLKRKMGLILSIKKEFYNRKCRFCNKDFVTKNDRDWYCCEKCKENNKKIIRKNIRKRYKENHLDKLKETKRKSDKKYYEKNKNKIEFKQKRKQYRENNKEKTKEYRKKRRQNPKNRLNHNISSLILYSLKGNKNGNHWENIVNYTLNKLIEHLELTSKYSIQDYLEKDLHIDHIIPISTYNFKSFENEEFKKCWNLRNLRLITAKENLSKSNNLDMDLVEKYKIKDLLPR